MPMLINEMDQLKYVIKVNGTTVSIPFATKMLAEQFIASLPKEQQPIAEVVPVTNEGKELLLG
jgi:hypothetical protein